MKHILSVLVENRAGVLYKVAGMFSRRAFNIESLVVGVTQDPSVSRIDLEWNTPQLWAAIDEGADPIAPEKLEHPYAWLLWRKELLNYYRSLDIDEAYSLDSAIQGGDFSNLCEGVCEWIDEEHAPARVAGFLAGWINEDLLINIRLNDETS